MRYFLACLMMLVLGGSAFAQAQSCSQTTQTIKIWNNEPKGGKTIYPVVEVQNKPRDNWMIGWFQNCGKSGYNHTIPQSGNYFQMTRIYRIYVNETTGLAPGQAVQVTLPFFTQLATSPDGSMPDQVIDWWNAGRVYIYDDATQLALRLNADFPFVPPSSAITPACQSLQGDPCARVVIRTGAGLPASDLNQLTEYTLAATVTGQWPYTQDLPIAGYNISSVDQTYLPLAMAPIRGTLPKIPYIGTNKSLQNFRDLITQWKIAFPGWPLYSTSNMRIPGAFNVFALAFTGNSTIPKPVDLDRQCDNFIANYKTICSNVIDMINIYSGTYSGTGGTSNCLTSMAGICVVYNPLVNNGPVNNPTMPKGLFQTNFDNWFASSCRDMTQDKVDLTVRFMRKIYGWVPFNESAPGCSPAISNALLGSAGSTTDDEKTKTANFGLLLSNYVTQLQEAGSNGQWGTPSFNPYVLLIQNYLNEAAYAYSIDDDKGFQMHTATGFVITFSGNGGSGPNDCPGLDLCVPLDRNKRVEITPAVQRNAPPVTQWAQASICSDSVAPIPPGGSVTFYPQPNEIPCPIILTDTAGQTYQVNLLNQPPLTSTSLNNCSVARPLNNGWCPSGGATAGFVPNNNNYINTNSQTPGPRPSTHDFNGDGFSDILWLDTKTGNARVWLYQPGQPIVDAVIGNLSGFSSVGQRDYDADGKADLVWQDNAGDASIWFMNGAGLVPLQTNPAIPQTWGLPSLGGLKIAGTGDFNNDSLADVLLTDGNGNFWVWLLDAFGKRIATAGQNIGPPPVAGGKVVGTGDFNGDGFTDILWLNSAGDMAISFMQGITILNPGQGVVGNITTAWTVVGTGDFNGDGMADLVLRDTSGDTAIWLMNGTKVIANAGLGNQSKTLSIAATGDYNRDGKSDLLWHNDATGDVSIWFMNGTTVTSTAPVGNLPTNWVIQSLNAL